MRKPLHCEGRAASPVIWEEILLCAGGKAAHSFAPSKCAPGGSSLGAGSECLKMRRGLFKFMVRCGKSKCTTSLPTRLPEVYKILVKAARGASALHHIAARRNARAQGRGVEKPSFFLPGSWKRGGPGVEGCGVLINQSLPNITGIWRSCHLTGREDAAAPAPAPRLQTAAVRTESARGAFLADAADIVLRGSGGGGGGGGRGGGRTAGRSGWCWDGVR